MLIYHDNSN